MDVWHSIGVAGSNIDARIMVVGERPVNQIKVKIIKLMIRGYKIENNKRVNLSKPELEEEFKKKEEAAPAPPPKPSEEVTLLQEIRDLMKKD